MKREKLNLLLSMLLSIASASSFALSANAAGGQNLSAEVVAKVWQEEGDEVASVNLNGRELLCFRGDASSGMAAERAEDLASKLQEVLDDRKFDAQELLPARAGVMASLQIAGSPVLSFEPSGVIDSGKDFPGSTAELSLRLANSIRTAYGAAQLPASFLKLSGSDAGLNCASGKFSGQASWYGPRFHGRKTSDGSRFDQEKLTAAHRSLPFGTKLLVMNRRTGATCVVKVNDRGPFVGHRVIDLSKGAARQLKMLSSGVALVDCLVLGTE